MRVGVVAPGARIPLETAEGVSALAADLYPALEIVFHPQCFLSDGHFAGPDEVRAAAFLEVANDERFDALWFANGGYGAGRLTELVVPRLTEAARRKTYLGYSDAGSLLGALYASGFQHVAHGPMPRDLTRENGATAVRRALTWLVERSPESLEPSISPGDRTAAFNIVILSHLLGTPWLPDLSGHILMLEDVSEHMYRIDRCLLQLTSNPQIRGAAGIRLGRVSAVPPNDPDFGRTEEEVVRYWCERSGIRYLGRADIGHDADNKVVPFGLAATIG
ncbi:MAG: LD-carboxypeptidase [Brevundimonas sp.]|nr:MAG: LD-carboxypeptidase [Brevundimonas sp.]